MEPHCTSPPGVPQAMANSPSRSASAGFGVRRGRLPGSTNSGWSGSRRPCVPRAEGAKPRPSTIGVSYIVSDGVSE